MQALARPLKWPPVFPLEKGLVLWLPFDDRSGAKAIDRSGKGNHGPLYGPTWVVGRRGSALSFDGVDDNLQIPHHPSLNPVNGAITCMAWIKTNAPLEIRGILRKWHPATYYLLHQGSVFSFAFTIGNGVTWKSVNSLSAPQAGVWTHIAGLNDPVTRGLQVFVNGVLENTNPEIGLVPDTHTDPLIIPDVDDARIWNGVIDEVRIYNRALNAAEVKRLYESEILLARH